MCTDKWVASCETRTYTSHIDILINIPLKIGVLSFIINIIKKKVV